MIEFKTTRSSAKFIDDKDNWLTFKIVLLCVKWNKELYWIEMKVIFKFFTVLKRFMFVWVLYIGF